MKGLTDAFAGPLRRHAAAEGGKGGKGAALRGEGRGKDAAGGFSKKKSQTNIFISSCGQWKLLSSFFFYYIKDCYISSCNSRFLFPLSEQEADSQSSLREVPAEGSVRAEPIVAVSQDPRNQSEDKDDGISHAGASSETGQTYYCYYYCSCVLICIIHFSCMYVRI